MANLATLMKQHKVKKASVVNPGMSAAAVLVLMRAAEQEDNTESQIDTALECVAMNNELLVACETDADKKAVTKLMNTMIVGQTGTSLESAEAYFVANDVDKELALEGVGSAAKNLVMRVLTNPKTPKWFTNFATRTATWVSKKWTSFGGFTSAKYSQATGVLKDAAKKVAEKLPEGAVGRAEALKASASGNAADFLALLKTDAAAKFANRVGLIGAATAGGTAIGIIATKIVMEVRMYMPIDDFDKATKAIGMSAKGLEALASMKISGEEADDRFEDAKKKVASIMGKLSAAGLLYDEKTGKASGLNDFVKIVDGATPPIAHGWDPAAVEKRVAAYNAFFAKHDDKYLSDLINKSGESVGEYAGEASGKLQLNAFNAVLIHMGKLSSLCDHTISKLGVVKKGEKA